MSKRIPPYSKETSAASGNLVSKKRSIDYLNALEERERAIAAVDEMWRTRGRYLKRPEQR